MLHRIKMRVDELALKCVKDVTELKYDAASNEADEWIDVSRRELTALVTKALYDLANEFTTVSTVKLTDYLRAVGVHADLIDAIPEAIVEAYEGVNVGAALSERSENNSVLQHVVDTCQRAEAMRANLAMPNEGIALLRRLVHRECEVAFFG